MPYIIHPRQLRKMVAALFAGVLLVVTVPAVASAACPSSPSSTLLEKLGDTAYYTLLTGSTFESGAEGWSLRNAEVASGPGAYNSTGSLVIEDGGEVVSPTFCVSAEYPSFRFFARQVSAAAAGGWWGSRYSGLDVSLRYTDMWGFPHDANVATLHPPSTWTLSPVLKLASALPLWMRGNSLKVRLVLQANGGAWGVDDVFIDPYRR